MEKRIEEQLSIIKDIIIRTIPVEQIYLFGSYAYGTPTLDSDLDIYVIMKDDAPYSVSEAKAIVYAAVFGHTSIPTDILLIKKSRFQCRLTAPTLKQEVAERGLIMYG